MDESIIGILAGPTASGKSALAVELALRHKLAIISADSMQVYRGMEVGTGVLPVEARRGVPHFLVGVAEPTEDYQAARFAAEARQTARSVFSEQGRRSLVVGGTGLWIDALREGLFEGPGRDEALRQHLRERLDREGPEALHEELAALDPPTAARLSPRDHVRVLRALEVQQLSGRPLSDWVREDQARRQSLGPLLPLVVLDRPRAELDLRIDRRVDEMIAEGWLEEARHLHALGLPDHSPARKALGYRELFRVIDGEWSMDQAVEEIKKQTRQFSRRQMTWFRGRREVTWLAEPNVAGLERALGLMP